MGHGLVLDPGVTLDLAGHTIWGDSTFAPGEIDTGITLGGGRVFGGSIRGFRFGIVSNGAAKVSNMSVVGPGETGISIVSAGAGTAISGTTVSRALTGIAVSAPQAAVVGNRSVFNAVAGISLTARGFVSRNVASHNGAQGIVVGGGVGSVVSRNLAERNGSTGIEVNSTEAEVLKNVANDNSGHGIFVMGSNAVVTRNTTAANTIHGINVTGTSASVARNTSRANTADGIAVGGDAAAIARNVVGGNLLDGIDFNGDSSVITHNTAVANGDEGIEGSGDNLTFKKNAVISNGSAGIEIFDDADAPSDTISFIKNRAFNNGHASSAGADPGIHALAATNVAGKKNVASGNEASVQCAPSTLCN